MVQEQETKDPRPVALTVLPSSSALPPFDRGLTSRNICIAGLAITCLLACSTIGWFAYSRHYTWIHCNAAYAELLKLCLTGIVLIATESSGFIHTASLRWALHREGRLFFNSNVRLFTAVGSGVNSWWINTLLAMTLVLAYASASQTFLTSAETIIILPLPLMLLGLCLLAHAIVAILCLYQQSKRIPSYSSNPLNTTLASLRDQPEQQHIGSVLAVGQGFSKNSLGSKPSKTQPSMLAADPGIRHVIRFSWVLGPLCLIWACAVLAVTSVLSNNDSDNDPSAMLFSSNTSLANVGGRTTIGSLGAVFILAGFQAFATMGLHFLESVINRSRDEAAWRQAMDPKKGVLVGWRSLLRACSSWQSLMLSAAKVLVHWLFGLSIPLDGGGSIGMCYLAIFLLGGVATMLAFIATAIARHKPKGYIPATYGHLQTLANLIDDWAGGTDGSNRLFWGDKGQALDDLRHAGTIGNPDHLGKIDAEALYD